MNKKTVMVALFIFILVVMFFLFPEGCPQEGFSAQRLDRTGEVTSFD